MKFFENIYTIDALKAEYKRLIKIHHPDVGGDNATMAAINNEYDEKIAYFKKYGERAEQAKAAKEVPEAFRAVVSAVVLYDDLTVELVGSWIWVTGNTFGHLDVLHAAGYHFASRKKAWYWHAPEDKVMRASKMTLEEIKAKHGATLIDHAAHVRPSITAD